MKRPKRKGSTAKSGSRKGRQWNLQIFDSFEAADRAEREYWLAQTQPPACASWSGSVS